MFRTSIVSVVSLALVLSSVVGLGGCAADADPTSSEEQSEVVVVASPSREAEGVTPKYVPKVTRADIVSGFGTCVGTTCQINGKVWDCSGGGYCTLAQ